MTITQLALETAIRFPSKERVLCPNSTVRDLAVKLLHMAGIALNLKRFWTVRTYDEEGKFYIKLDADNPFSVNEMVGSIHTMAEALLNWRTEAPEDLAKSTSNTDIQEVITNPVTTDLKVISTEISNIALGKFEFFATILKHRKYHTVFEICYLEQAHPRLYLIGRKDVVDDIFRKFQELLRCNHLKVLNLFLASKY